MENRIFGYDLIRSLAIFLVMIGHSLGFLYFGNYSFFLSFLSGFLGVELFFVLSGVLIGKLLIEVFDSNDFQQKLKNFIVRRWFRTLPLYFLMLLVYYFGNRYFDPIQNNDVQFWKYVFFLQNFYTVQPTFFGVSWSLSVEEWFYVLFPLCLYLLKKSFPKISIKQLFLIAILIFVGYSLMLRIMNLSVSKFQFYEGVRKVAFFRLDAIAFGIFSAWLMEFFREKVFEFKRILLLFGALVLFANQYFIFKNNYQNLDYFNSIYYTFLGVGICFLFPFFKETKVSSHIFSSLIIYVSKISYSLYLVHWIIFKILEMDLFSSLSSYLKFPLFFLLSFISAGILYHFFEKPILDYRNRITSR